jgi:hypothetical protein
MVEMGRLSGVTCCFSRFVDIRGRRTGCDFLDLSDGVGLSARLGTRGGLADILRARKRCERLCGDLLAMHQRKCTLGKIETFSHLASDEITDLWVKLCNLWRVKIVMIAMLMVMINMDLSHD